MGSFVGASVDVGASEDASNGDDIAVGGEEGNEVGDIEDSEGAAVGCADESGRH